MTRKKSEPEAVWKESGEPVRPPTLSGLDAIARALDEHAEQHAKLLGTTIFQRLRDNLNWQMWQLVPRPKRSAMKWQHIQFWRGGETVTIDRTAVEGLIDPMDLWRYLSFCEGIDRKGWEQAADFAVNKLKDTSAAAGPDAMVYSYKKVERLLSPEQRRPRRHRRSSG